MTTSCNLFHSLDAIRKAPSMYFGEKSLRDLSAFITGYIIGKQDGCGPDGDPDEVRFRTFNEFVARKLVLPPNTPVHWHHLISRQASSESVAFDQFFDLLDEFRGSPCTSR